VTRSQATSREPRSTAAYGTSEKLSGEVNDQSSERATKQSAQRSASGVRSKRADLKTFHSEQSSWIDALPEAPTFRPSFEEFSDPVKYLTTVAAEAKPWGICKIIPPVSAAVPGMTVLLETGQNRFPTRQQYNKNSAHASLEDYKFYSSGKDYTVAGYECFANKYSYSRYSLASGFSSRFVEAEYWREWFGRGLCVEYGNDVEGSAFSTCDWDPLATSPWSFRHLNSERGSSLRLLPQDIPGVSSPMLYIGMLFSTFAWHVEDLYMHSINFHHFGAPKTWYGVPSSSADDFEEVVMEKVYHTTREARSLEKSQFTRQAIQTIMGKATMFSPKLLTESGVKVCRCVQHPGEFVVTFPRSYHAGFSHGFNCGEAINIALPDWFQYGLAANVRHSILRQPPIMSVELLLCKEADRLLAEASLDGVGQTAGQAPAQATAAGTASVLQDQRSSPVRLSFTRLMMWQNSVRERIEHCGGVMYSMGDGTSATPSCGSCALPCSLAAVLPALCTEAQEIMCLRCAAKQADRTLHGSIVMCASRLQIWEEAAKRWQRLWQEGELDEAERLEAADALHGNSKLMNEPGWWALDSKMRQVSRHYEWPQLRPPQPRVPAAWEALSSALAASEQEQAEAAGTPAPAVRAGKQASGRKRPGSTVARSDSRGKASKLRKPPVCLQNVQQEGRTGSVPMEAMEEGDALSGCAPDESQHCKQACTGGVLPSRCSPVLGQSPEGEGAGENQQASQRAGDESAATHAAGPADLSPVAPSLFGCGNVSACMELGDCPSRSAGGDGQRTDGCASPAGVAPLPRAACTSPAGDNVYETISAVLREHSARGSSHPQPSPNTSTAAAASHSALQGDASSADRAAEQALQQASLRHGQAVAGNRTELPGQHGVGSERAGLGALCPNAPPPSWAGAAAAVGPPGVPSLGSSDPSTAGPGFPPSVPKGKGSSPPNGLSGNAFGLDPCDLALACRAVPSSCGLAQTCADADVRAPPGTASAGKGTHEPLDVASSPGPGLGSGRQNAADTPSEHCSSRGRPPVGIGWSRNAHNTEAEEERAKSSPGIDGKRSCMWGAQDPRRREMRASAAGSALCNPPQNVTSTHSDRPWSFGADAAPQSCGGNGWATQLVTGANDLNTWPPLGVGTPREDIQAALPSGAGRPPLPGMPAMAADSQGAQPSSQAQGGYPEKQYANMFGNSNWTAGQQSCPPRGPGEPKAGSSQTWVSGQRREPLGPVQAHHNFQALPACNWARPGCPAVPEPNRMHDETPNCKGFANGQCWSDASSRKQSRLLPAPRLARSMPFVSTCYAAATPPQHGDVGTASASGAPGNRQLPIGSGRVAGPPHVGAAGPRNEPALLPSWCRDDTGSWGMGDSSSAWPSPTCGTSVRGDVHGSSTTMMNFDELGAAMIFSIE